jgi:thiol-disulfide isomerase/thioredoxin
MIILTLPKNANANFFSERYRGWFWFEQAQEIKTKRNDNITSEEAAKEIEDLRINMDQTRNIMITRPTSKNVLNYIKLEQKMWSRALKLDEAFREAKFKYPEYFDKLSDPTNIHAVKFKRKIEREKLEKNIRSFASKYDLVLFSKEDCKYSKSFSPVLQKFGSEYGFLVEEVSIKGELTGYFVGKKIPNLAAKLGIKETPTIVAISKKGDKAFEMIRGYASISELQEYTELANNYGEEISRNIIKPVS